MDDQATGRFHRWPAPAHGNARARAVAPVTDDGSVAGRRRGVGGGGGQAGTTT